MDAEGVKAGMSVPTAASAGPTVSAGVSRSRRVIPLAGFSQRRSNEAMELSRLTTHRAQMMNPEIAIITTDQIG